MVDFTKRSYDAELMDDIDNVQKDVLRQTLRELRTVNRFLGGHAITIHGLKHLMKDKSRPYSIVDYGCGGGDTLVAISRWADRQGIEVSLVGVDFNPDVIEYARETCCSYPNINFINEDLFQLEHSGSLYDISICSLFCHHFEGARLRKLVTVMWQSARLGIVINDLHRHPQAYYGIRLLTGLFSHSTMVKHDGPLSVLRGFTRLELDMLVRETPMINALIQWKWAFRYLITAEKAGNGNV